MQRVARTLTKAELWASGGRNILPKYGFQLMLSPGRRRTPEDEVGARVSSTATSSSDPRVRPGSTLVAGGKLWTSGGVYRLPERESGFGYH